MKPIGCTRRDDTGQPYTKPAPGSPLTASRTAALIDSIHIGHSATKCLTFPHLKHFFPAGVLLPRLQVEELSELQCP